MVDMITPLRLSLLQVVAKNPGIGRERLLALNGVQPADLAYLEQHDLMREREVGCFRVSHLGTMALKRAGER